MELVEGETLADMIAQRPRSSPGLPFEGTVGLARQIASALEAAHEKGIILVVLIEDARVIERILGHLGVPAEVSAARPARAPPLAAEPLWTEPDDDQGLPAETHSSVAPGRPRWCGRERCLESVVPGPLSSRWSCWS